ncbi:MAG: hypothetical protein ACQEXX_00045 [Bacillota bacterium]
MTDQLKADIGIATITAQGILFNGKIYTNRSVIKKRWFVLARDEGEWEIPVVHIHDYHEAIIIISLKHQEVSLATWVDIGDMNVKKVEHYHNQLNELKQLKKNIAK